MTNRPASPRPVISASPEFDFIAGRFADSSKKVAYFLTVMNYKQISASLRLVSELPGAASYDWKLEELYQREINWFRVEKRIVPYLRQTSQAQFFNAITVALLPCKNGRVIGMADESWNPPKLPSQEDFSPDGCVKTFGPISCGYWGNWTGPGHDNARLGRICWNLDEVAAVAIDGQHRLAAIKMFHSASSESKSSVPVILVVAHPDLGVDEGQDGAGSVSITRKLFIDLNKHAVKVSRARQILLDDHDPVSVCTRAIVGSSLQHGDAEFLESRLPLTIVDWHTEQAKFDTGPYVTTILGLDWAVSQFLGFKPYKDPLNYDEAESILGCIENSLGVRLEDARRRLKTAEMAEGPFDFEGEDEGNELGLIKIGFMQAWAPALVTLLRSLKPYAALMRDRVDDKTLSPEFASWWVVKSRIGSTVPAADGQALRRIEEELKLRKDVDVSPKRFEALIEQYRKSKLEAELAFSVAFQRAYFLAFEKFLAVRDLASEGGTDDGAFGPDDSDDERIDTRSMELGSGRRIKAEQFVEAVNAVSEAVPEFYSRSVVVGGRKGCRLWAHSLLREDDDAIDFTAGASKRGADLIVCAAILYHYKLSRKVQRAFDDVWESIQEAGAGGGVLLKLRQACDRMTKDTGLGGRIAAAIDNPPITDKSEREIRGGEEVKRRLSAIWEAIRT